MNSFLLANREVSSSSTTSRTTGMPGVSPYYVSTAMRHNERLADVEIHHLEKFQKLRFENISIAAEGPLRASLKSTVKYGQSTINVVVRGHPRSVCLPPLTFSIDLSGCHPR